MGQDIYRFCAVTSLYLGQKCVLGERCFDVECADVSKSVIFQLEKV